MLKIIFFIFLFFIFYYEPDIIVGQITFSQIWKIPLILILTALILYNRWVNKSFSRFSLYYSIKSLFNDSLLKFPITNIIEFFRNINFFILFEFFSIYIPFNPKINSILLYISQFWSLSNLPFLFGILTSKKQGISIGEQFSYTGIFQNPHAASVVLSFSLVVLLFSLKRSGIKWYNHSFNIVLIFVNIICILSAFVRTGYFICFLGIYIIFHPVLSKIKRLFVYYLFLAIFITYVFSIINSNQVIKNRIFDLNNGKQMSAGSGRLNFATISINYWAEGNLFVIFFGRGLDNVKANLYNKTGMRIFSHNGFVDALVVNGVFGFIFFILFYIFWGITIISNSHSQFFVLNVAFYLMYIFYQIFQGGTTFATDLYIALAINLFPKYSDEY